VTKSEEFMQRLLDQGIKPHAEEIEGVWREHGEVAVVFFELTPELREEMARAFRWNGDATVVRMPPEVARRIVSECKGRGDEVTPRWLTEKRGWPPSVGASLSSPMPARRCSSTTSRVRGSPSSPARPMRRGCPDRRASESFQVITRSVRRLARVRAARAG
jgi:hypothetical protein